MLLGKGREGLCVASRSLDKHIEGAVGRDAAVAGPGQTLVEEFSVAVVGGGVRLDPCTKADDLLDQGGGADIAQGSGGPCNGVIDVAGMFQGRGDQDIADPLSRHGQRLAVGVADNGIPVDEGDEGRGLAVIDQFPVGLIRNKIKGASEFLGFFLKKPGQQA